MGLIHMLQGLHFRGRYRVSWARPCTKTEFPKGEVVVEFDINLLFSLCVVVCPEDGELYAGTSVDFMGANAAIFRTTLQGSSQHYIRTEAYDHNWLNGETSSSFFPPSEIQSFISVFQFLSLFLVPHVPLPPPPSVHLLSPSEPEFVGSFSIPDTRSPDDDKVYFFFKEKAVEAGQWDQRVYSRVARVCKVERGREKMYDTAICSALTSHRLTEELLKDTGGFL